MNRSDVFAFLSAVFLLVAPALAENTEQTLDVPPPLDVNAALIERYWDWLKLETGAPFWLAPPPIEVAPLPRAVRMAFVFPVESRSWEIPRIMISPRAIDRAQSGERLVVIAELAHELVHFVLLMRENGWDIDRSVYANEIHHHCDAEFQRLTRQVAEFLWQAYHSRDTTRAVEQMVRLACWRDGHVLSERTDN